MPEIGDTFDIWGQYIEPLNLLLTNSVVVFEHGNHYEEPALHHESIKFSVHLRQALE
jgi:hypothetical protein